MAKTDKKPKAAKAAAAPKADPEPETAPHRTWMEEIEVSGEQLVQKVKDLAAEGHVKRIRVKEPDGDIALDIPLTYGAIVGGVLVLAAPILAVIGALAAFVSKVTVEIVREEPKSGGKKT